MKKRYAVLVIVTGLLGLQGCAGPAAFHVASLASVVVTGKSVSEHALSVATEQDCSFYNLIQSERICLLSDYVEISLLTDNQVIDEQLLFPYKVEKVMTNPEREKELYLVLASFASLEAAKKYQVEHSQWRTKLQEIISNDQSRFRILVRVKSENSIESLKRSLTLAGVIDFWQIRM